jgi:hypothetical protein
MSATFEVDITKFLKLLHSMVRVDTDPADPQRSTDVMIWATDKGVRLNRALTHDQRRLLAIVVSYFRELRNAPSLTILRDRVQRQDKSEPMEFILSEYEKFASSFDTYHVHDMDALLSDITNDFDTMSFMAAMQKAMQIANMGVTGDGKYEKDMRGVQDARMFVLKELQKSGGTVSADVGGSVAELGHQVIGIYDRNRQGALNDNLVIKTGIDVIDRGIYGMERGTLNFILGHSGQRKSAFARTCAYNAVMQGHRVLYLPFETTFETELATFALMHANNAELFQGTEHFSIDRFRKGLFTEEEEKFLQEEIVPAFVEDIGDKLIIKQLADTTWESVRSFIELQNFINPIDLVVLDYYTLMDFSAHRDQVAAINNTAKEVKQMCVNFPNGRGGLVILSPVQGSKKGFEEAKGNEGTWDKTGIYMYGEIYKSASVIFYTFLDDEMQRKGEIKIGTCKSRDSADVPTQTVPINLNCGIISSEDPTSRKSSETDITAGASLLKDPSLVNPYL